MLLKDDFITIKNELSLLSKTDKIELILCPPTTYLYLFQDSIYKIGSQEISKYPNGAYTGENSAEQLKSLNVSYVLIGHPESRNILKETEESLINKMLNAYHNNIKIIYFIGENEDNKYENKTQQTLLDQLNTLKKIPKEIIKNIIIAYEPIWSIGSGQTPTIEELNKNINFINNITTQEFQYKIPVIYGGSINNQNITNIVKNTSLDGVILGESSANIDTLKEIYNLYKKIIESTK